MLDISKLVPGETALRDGNMRKYVFMGIMKDCLDGKDLVLFKHNLLDKTGYLAMELDHIQDWEIEYEYDDVTGDCQISGEGRLLSLEGEAYLMGLPPGYIWKKEFVYDENGEDGKEYLSIMKIKQ